MAESIEFEHFIGLNCMPTSTIFHPDGQKYISSNGANVVIGDLIDPHSQQFLRKHDDTVSALALSPSGNFIASGQCGENADVLVWDFHSQRIMYRFEEHDFGVVALSFSHDEKIFASLGHADDGKIIIWDLSNGCIIAAATNLQPGVLCLKFAGMVKNIKRRDTDHYQLCSAGRDGVVVWDLDPYTGDFLPQKLLGEARATISRVVTDICFSDDYEYLYAATTSGDYLIASIRSLKIMRAIQATRKQLNSIMYYNGGVVIACGDATVKLYNVNAEMYGEVKLDGDVISLSPSADRLEVLAATATGSISRINLSNRQAITIAESHTDTVLKVAFDVGTNERFATASMDGTIKVWDLVEYSVTAIARRCKDQDSESTPLCLAFANLLISGWSDGSVLAHNAEDGSNLWMLKNAHPGGVTALVLSHNRRFILTGGPQGEVRLWELRSRELISHLKEHKQKVTSLALFEDDTLGISGSRDRCMLRWDLRSELRVHCHMQRMGGINDMVITNDQQMVVSVGQDRKIVLWDNRHADAVYSVNIDEENDEAFAIAKSYDGKMFATGGTAGIIRMWSLHATTATLQNPYAAPPPAYSLHRTCEVQGHSKAILGLAFSLDDKQIVSVGEDGAIFVWTVFSSGDS